MLEVNAIYFILLVEGFGLLLFLILLWILITVFRLRRKSRVIRELAARVKKRADTRGRQTEAFFQAAYQLEEADLYNALQAIEKHENEFFQLLVEALREGKQGQIGKLDAALDKLIESYKCLQPRAEQDQASYEQARQQIETLRGENDELRSELSLAKNNLSDMLAEFGNMFGGGKDHELDPHDLKKKLAALQRDVDVDIKLPG